MRSFAICNWIDRRPAPSPRCPASGASSRRAAWVGACAWLVAAFAIAASSQARAVADEPTSQPESAPATQPAETQPAETQPADSRPASQPGSAPTSKPGKGAASTSTSSSSSSAAAEEEKDEYLAIVHGTVHTVTGGTLPNATVLCKNGRILDVGANLPIPTECKIVDATNRHVYPGFVAVAAAGIHNAPNPEDTTDVFRLNFELASAAGITAAAAGEDVAKVTLGSIDGMLLRRGGLVDLSGALRSPLSRRELRRDLDKVRKYIRDQRRYELEKASNEDAEEPDKSVIKGKLERYMKLLTGELLATAQADRVTDLREVADLAATYGFEVTIRGAAEGWICASDLARARANVIVTPRRQIDPTPTSNQPTGSSIETARILQDHGLAVAVVPAQPTVSVGGLAGRDLLNLNMEAAFAVRGGMTNENALRTITIDAARALGVEDRVGSIEVGKDADLIVMDGDALSYLSLVWTTIVNGKVVYEKEKSNLLSHVRPTGDPDQPDTTFDDIWPRTLEWPENFNYVAKPKKPAKGAATSSNASSPSSGPSTSAPTSAPRAAESKPASE